MNVDFGFLEPLATYYLFALIPIIVLIWWAYHNRALVVQKLLGAGACEAPTDRGIPRSIPWRETALLIIPLTVLTLALARPYFGHEKVEVPVPGVDYMFVVDISQSMLAKDISPSRIEVAKRKMFDIIQEFRERGASSRFGITLFAGSAYLYCPLTADYAVLKQFINSISPGLVTTRGSNITAGIEVALERLKGVRSSSGRLLLLSDGEDLKPTYDKVVASLTAEKVPLDGIGFGSKEGSPIEVRTGFFLKDSRGETVISHLQDDLLKHLSRETGGVYLQASVGDNDISTIADAALKRFSSGGSVVTFIDQYGEFGSWLALLGGILILIISSVRRCGLSILSLFPLFLLITVYSSSTPAFCQEAPSLKVKEGTPFEFFTAGKYPEAIAAYRELLQQRPTDSTLKKGLAASLYHNREYAEAAKVYGDIADKTTKGHEFFENKYNQGNALLKGEKLQEAIEAYEKALQSKPDDPKALHNKEVARALAEEKKREEEKKQQEKKESKKEEQKEENGDNQPENSTSQDESSQPSTASATPSPPLEQKEEEGKDKNKEEQQETTPKSEENENGGKDEGTEDVPPATPSLTEGEKTPTQQQGEGQDKDTGDETESPEEGTPVTETPKATQQSETEKSMPPTEAEMWIESLPDAPLLLRRHRGPPPASGQTW